MANIEARMMGRSLRKDVEDAAANERVRDDVGKKYFGFSDMASPRYAAGERGQQAVEIAERMRVAARLSEIEDDLMRTTQPSRPYESDPKFTGPKYTGQPQTFSGDLYDAALRTVDFEARKDKQGNVDVYKLPAGDMGGSYEVAGINDKYHPEAFKRISALPAPERRGAAAKYIVEYTSPIVSKLPQAIQPFAQDMVFNRGPGGATRYLQQGLKNLGLNVRVDGALGPETIRALGQIQPSAIMQEASKAQLSDEYTKAYRNPERKQFIPGLENRIRNRLALFGNV